MRTEKEMMDLLLKVAQKEERIRFVTLEGSRANPAIPDDPYKDYDISYFVPDVAAFRANEDWLEVFGPRLMMQKPEESTLYPATLGNWFSYLMLFEDGNRIDLKLIPLRELADYFAKSDGLVKVLLDKDQRLEEPVIPTDKEYWIKPPTQKNYEDCSNEFWWISTYVAKGLARKEFLYAADYLHQYLRPVLLKMMAWEIGAREGYTFSLGKQYKFLEPHVKEEDWQTLLSTFQADSYQHLFDALIHCQELFRTYAKKVAVTFSFPYPDYDEKVTPFIQELNQEYSKK